MGAVYWLPTPLPGSYVQVLVKNPGGANVEVRVNDSTNQTLQYAPSRPFEAANPASWYALTVALNTPIAYWGGANDGIVHGNIIGISILAKPTLSTVGAIDFDDVKLLGVRAVLLDPVATPVVAPAITDFTGSLGVEITHADATASGLNLAHSLGFGRIRTEMFWADVETQLGIYNFGWYDQLVANLKALGMQPHFILCYGNPIYTSADWFQPPLTPAAITGFANFAKAAAAHYAGQGVHFEVWNEPDIAGFWNPPNAAQYSALCPVAAAAVHAGDASAPVSSGGLAGLDLAFLDQVIADGGARNVDAIGIHSYRLEIPELLSDDLAELHTTLAQAFPTHTPPVWSTEAGYSSAWYGDGSLAANRTLQAKYGVRQVLTGLGLGLPVQIVFALGDAGTNVWDSEENFGIVSSTYQSKPITTALQTLYKVVKKHTFAGTTTALQSATHVFKFQGSLDTVFVCWSETVPVGTQVVYFPEMPTTAIDYMGNPVTVTPHGNGLYEMSISDTPVYVSFANPAKANSATAPVQRSK